MQKLDEEKAKAILKDGVWASNNGCVIFYVEFVEDGEYERSKHNNKRSKV